MESKLEIPRYFTEEGKTPTDSFDWTKSDEKIKDSSGNLIYSGKGLRFPDSWKKLPRKVVASKYFYRGDSDDYIEKDLGQLVKRVAETISTSGVKQNYFSKEDASRLSDEISHMVMDQKFAFNSPVWFNIGLFENYGIKEKSNGKSSHWAINEQGKFTNEIDVYERPQASACFIMSIGDDMRSIMKHSEKEAMLFKLGSGTGTNYGLLRGVREPLSGGGYASGQTSFMKIFDIIAGSVQSGGKTRRAAKMVIEPCDHPDLFRFINWKVEEEKKGLWLCANQRWGPKGSGDLESEAYKTVGGQNGNNSIRVTDDFMEAALRGEDWNLWFITKDRFDNEVEIALEDYLDDRYLPDKRFIKKLTNKKKIINAGEALEQIARAAAVTGDPSLQYDSTINKWHTCPNSGRINASNPCSEYMFIDDSACNLASLNLTKFRDETSGGIIDTDALGQAVRNSIIAQDIIVDYASYPDEKIAVNSHLFRALGLGYTNLGALLMENGIAYDSDEGRAIASSVTSLMTAQAYQTSAELASKMGAFEEFEKNKEPMLNVLKMHHEEIKKIKKIKGLETILDIADKTWQDAIEKGEQYGFRNAQVTLLAPTGTIGFMMDVDCTGIEPMPALVYEKGLAGGGELEMEIKPCVTKGLQTLGYKQERLEEILEYAKENGTMVGAPHLKEEHYNVFATAFGDNTICVDGHLKMMAAVQPFLSGAISKTVNLPKGATIQDVRDTYIKGWKLGLKSISLYIDGSKGVQPLNIKTKQNGKELKWGERVKPRNPMMPSGFIERPGWNIEIGNNGVHLMVGEYSDRSPKDSPADFFVEFGSSGSEFSAVYTDWAKEASRNRQRGMPLEEFIKHNKASSDPINGFTDHQFIKTCKGIKDFFTKLIQLEYLGDTSVCDVQPTDKQVRELRCNVLANKRRIRHHQSRIDFIEFAMEDGELTEIFPLYEDKLGPGEMSVMDIFCVNCGSKTVPSGANCRKCPNCGDSAGCG